MKICLIWFSLRDPGAPHLADFAGCRPNRAAQLGNEEGNPTIQVPLQAAIRFWFAGGCALIPVSGIRSAVYPVIPFCSRGYLQFSPLLYAVPVICRNLPFYNSKMKVQNEATKYKCSKSSGYFAGGSVTWVVWVFLFLLFLFHLFQLSWIIKSWLCWKVRWLRFF